MRKPVLPVSPHGYSEGSRAAPYKRRRSYELARAPQEHERASTFESLLKLRKKKCWHLSQHFFLNGRDDTIRTCDPLVPSEVRYQTALHPDDKYSIVRLKLRFSGALPPLAKQFTGLFRSAECYIPMINIQLSD